MELLDFVQATATKLCLPTGEWFRNDKNISWTNYSLCSPELVNIRDPGGNPLMLVRTLNYSL
jgi:hypothetical protein